MSRRDLPCVGWWEWVALPDLGIERIKAKVDTGADSSVIHAYDVRRVVVRGRPAVRFRVHPLQADTETVVLATAEMFDRRWVRSTSGRRTHRPVVRTTARLGDHAWRIDLTLARRDVMGFRMLLGREALRDRFLVDAGRVDLRGALDAASAEGGRVE
jgi:hypothetical protein